MDRDEKLSLKRKLLDHCITLLQERIASAKNAMEEAQASANSGEKSSVGDKYETTRAMGQLDRDMNARQLEEAQRDLLFMQGIDVNQIYNSVQQGSVVITNGMNFFISLGLGMAKLNAETFALLSAASPVARALAGKKSGEKFLFNGTETVIEEIF